MLCCKKHSLEKEKEIYKYDQSFISHSIDIYSENGLNRISFILNKKKNIVTIILYKKNIEKYENVKLEFTKDQTQLFLKVVDDQLKLTNFFYRIENVDGYDISFEMNFGKDHLVSSYKNVINFENEISDDFYKLILLLRKEKIVNAFFKKI